MKVPHQNDECSKHLVEVAVPAPLHSTFSYESDDLPQAGTRVLVPFGPRRLVGVALGPAHQPHDGYAIKPIIKPIDREPVYSATLLRLAHWMADYYQHPIGEVLRAMLPAGSSKVVDRKVALTEAGRALCEAEPSSPLGQLFGKRAALTRATINKKLGALGHEVSLLEGWCKSGLVREESKARMKARAISAEPGSESQNIYNRPTEPNQSLCSSEEVEPDLEREGCQLPLEEAAINGAGDSSTVSYTEEQQAAIDRIVASPAPGEARRPFLLWGVTGAGKTEVYMAAISRLLGLDQRGEQDGQVLLLVPEISLTPQMTMVFERRFPGQIAVVHSAMSDAQRWAELERIRSGDARVLIGPRSAVFAPFRRLRLVVVDEEHDSSYKQGSGLFYNGRDVAVLRGKWEGAVTILGSATPSLESFHNARIGKYDLIRLCKRATGANMPDVELVEVGPGHRHGLKVAKAGQLLPLKGIEAAEESGISGPLLQALRQNYAAGNQAMVLVNRRGFAYYLYSLENKKSLECPNCSISLTFHKHKRDLRCHYCDYSIGLDQVVRDRPHETLVAVGHGSQKVEGFLEEQIPGVRVARLDSDTVSDREVLPRTLSKFRAGEIDILVGTQMLAKGHDFPRVTLIAIVEVDQVINMPDFRAGERAFQLIVQAAGRAGRANLPGRVLIQTSKAEHPVIRHAIRQDYEAFAERELAMRRDFAYPPFTRMIAVEISSTDRSQCASWASRIEAGLAQFRKLRGEAIEGVRILGPSVPPVEILRNRYRRTFLFCGMNLVGLKLLGQFVGQVAGQAKGAIRIKIDVDPQSLL